MPFGSGGFRLKWMVLLVTLFAASPLVAQETLEQRVQRLQREVEELRRGQAAGDTTALAELRRQLEALTMELEALRLGSEVAVQADTSIYGFAPAASKVYQVRQGVSIGGYGEFHYENFAQQRQDDQPAGRQDRFDALRAILYFGYKFNDRLLFNSELEWEHGSTGRGGEASIEFAYVDYLLNPAFGLRGGLLLSPMGLTNELHEPPTFVGTTRPLVEQAIIPTTWRSNGFGFFGEMAGFEYRAYALTSLDAAGFGAGGLRGGRQKGANELAEDFSLVGRVDYTGILGLLVGGSVMTGETAHNRRLSGVEIGGRTNIWEVHADYSALGIDLRAMYAAATVDDVAQLNAAGSLAGNRSIGEKLTGAYAQAGYDVLRPLGLQHQLIPYVRYETLNTQVEVPAGFTSNPATDRTAWLIGAMWKPIPQVAVKADYQIHRNVADTGINQFNVNLSYLF